MKTTHYTFSVNAQTPGLAIEVAELLRTFSGKQGFSVICMKHTINDSKSADVHIVSEQLSMEALRR